jgi:hypothetical protein
MLDVLKYAEFLPASDNVLPIVHLKRKKTFEPARTESDCHLSSV